MTERAAASAERAADRAVVLHPEIGRRHPDGGRSPESRLKEAVGLAEAIGLEVVHAEVVGVGMPRPATLFGAGTVDRLRDWLSAEAEGGAAVTVVIVDGTLSPVQQRNLERAFGTKVIDRTGVILEIFGERARTAEGRLQVELAALTYQRSRLVRSWTHLERQRGGFGFLGGPGESQLETDRRLITERITRLRRELKEVKRTRGLHRTARQRVPFPVVALVGYTNAGKSTLFNRLTDAAVTARDQLFATLDPTMRRLVLPSGQVAILSDTVGFISDLPHELVEAFHATLEEVTEADMIVHVRDAAHPEAHQQKQDVLTVLGEIGAADESARPLIEVLNKVDLLSDDERHVLINRAERSNIPMVFLSARTGEGCDALLACLDESLTVAMAVMDVSLSQTEGNMLAWLYEHGQVLERRDEADAIVLKVRLSPADAARFSRRQAPN
ncbi:MAG: GTPase HflX [Rhodospirillales bacterium]|nr:MAG: GTPase HflX [Rhodospirillales bacterium]